MAPRAEISVDASLDALQHPRRPTIERLRSVLRGLDARVQESWKWNAPNYALGGDFATFRLQPKHAFQLILHAGAVKGAAIGETALEAPPGLLTRPADDRCVIVLDRLPDGEEGEHLLARLARDWLQALGRV